MSVDPKKRKYWDYVERTAPRLLLDNGGQLSKSAAQRWLEENYDDELPQAQDISNAYGHAFKNLYNHGITESAEHGKVYKLSASYMAKQKPEQSTTDVLSIDDSAASPESWPHNQVLYGPPGTGKTQELQWIREDYTDDDWAKLFLRGLNPIGASGATDAPTLLFPTEKVFEYYVAAQLRKQLARGARLQAQAAGRNLVEHLGSKWFRLRPDAVISVDGAPQVVLDSKWKLINGHQNNAREKYGLRERDFYQLFAYGENYLPDGGSLFLVYPKTPEFSAPLPPFRFQNGSQIMLWVVPFQLDPPHLLLPGHALQSERIWSRTGCLAPHAAAQSSMCDVLRPEERFA